MGLRKPFIECQSLARIGFRSGKSIAGQQSRLWNRPQERVGIRQASIRRRVRRVVFDGLLKESDGVRQALRGSLGPQVPPLEVSPIGLGVDLMLGLGILGQSREDL